MSNMQSLQEALKNDNEPFELFIDGKSYVGHLARKYVDRESLPEGWYAYDLGHTDTPPENDEVINEITEGYITENRFGTFYTTEQVPLDRWDMRLMADMDGVAVDYSFDYDDIHEHEPWDGDLPIEFLGGNDMGITEELKDGVFVNTQRLGEFYISHHNNPGVFSRDGAIEGRVIGYEGSDKYTIEYYAPVDYFDEIPAYTKENEGGSVSLKVPVDHAGNVSALDVYKLGSIEIPVDNFDKMFQFEKEDVILHKVKNDVYSKYTDLYEKMFNREYHSRKINELVEVGDWDIIEEGFKKFQSGEKVENTLYFGNVNYGNHSFNFYIDAPSNEGIYVQFVPEYNIVDEAQYKTLGQLEDRKFIFPFQEDDEYELESFLQYEIAHDPSSHESGGVLPCKEENLADIETFKASVVEKLLKDEMITRDAERYMFLKENGKCYHQQYEKARDNYLTEMAREDKLPPEAVEGLAVFYHNEYYNFEDTPGSVEKIVSKMNESGFSEPRIKLMFSAMPKSARKKMSNALGPALKKLHNLGTGHNAPKTR